MSVVNQMLRDLQRDSRGAGLTLNTGSVDAQEPTATVVPKILLVLIALAVIVGWIWFAKWPADEAISQVPLTVIDEATPMIDEALLDSNLANPSSETESVQDQSDLNRLTSSQLTLSNTKSQTFAAADSHPNHDEEALQSKFNIDTATNKVSVPVVTHESPKTTELNSTIEGSERQVANTSETIIPQNLSTLESTTATPKAINTDRKPRGKLVSQTSKKVVVKSISKTQRLENTLYEIDQLIAEGFYTRADEKLNELINSGQTSQAIIEKRAWVILQLGDTERTVRFLQQQLSQNPRLDNLRLMLAKIYAEQNNWQSITAMTAEASVENEELLLVRAVAMQQLTEHHEAINIYQRLLESDSSRGDWWIGLSISLTAISEFDAARQALERAQVDRRLTFNQHEYIRLKLNRLTGL